MSANCLSLVTALPPFSPVSNMNTGSTKIMTTASPVGGLDLNRLNRNRLRQKAKSQYAENNSN